MKLRFYGHHTYYNYIDGKSFGFYGLCGCRDVDLFYGHCAHGKSNYFGCVGPGTVDDQMGSPIVVV